MKYSKIAGAITWSGGNLMLHLNTTADDDHPLVKERPDLFTDEAPLADLRAPAREPEPEQEEPVVEPEPEPVVEPEPEQEEEPVVERATRRPGEMSQARDTNKPAPVPTKAARAKAKAEDKATDKE